MTELELIKTKFKEFQRGPHLFDIDGLAQFVIDYKASIVDVDAIKAKIVADTEAQIIQTQTTLDALNAKLSELIK